MLKKGVKIKLILLGLDEFSYKDNPDARLYQPLRHPYPPVLDQHPLPYYLRTYFSFLDWDIMQEVLNGYKKRLFKKSGDNLAFCGLCDTGQMYFYQIDRQIEENPHLRALRQQVKQDKIFLRHPQGLEIIPGLCVYLKEKTGFTSFPANGPIPS